MTDLRPHKIHGKYLPIELRRLALCINFSPSDPSFIYLALRNNGVSAILANALCVWLKRKEECLIDPEEFQRP